MPNPKSMVPDVLTSGCADVPLAQPERKSMHRAILSAAMVRLRPDDGVIRDSGMAVALYFVG